jgi:hypothetical protein
MKAPELPQEMQAEIDRFDQEAERIVVAFVGPMNSEPPPQALFHYTNDAGLKGILESGALWLSDMLDLNDPSEVRHGFSLAVDALTAKAEIGPPESKVFANHFRAFSEQGGIQAAAHYFVGSFSSDGDDLGQWRAYADNGRGYALEFDGKVLEDAYCNADGKPNPNNSTFHVTYNDKRLAEIQRQIIDLAFPLISLPRGRKLDSDILQAYMMELSVLVSLHTLRASLFFKHEAYRNEREFRFMQLHRADIVPPSVRLRARRSTLVKYRDFDWKSAAPAALTRIVIGPAADFDKAERFSKDCLNLFHSGKVNITRSTIPYRAL